MATDQSADPINLADTSLGQGDVASAWTWARRAIALDPHEPAAHNVLGIIADSVFDVESAVAAFGRALVPDPYNALVFGNIAGALGRAGVIEAAVRIGRRAIALSPSDAPTHNAAAHALKGAGYLPEAKVAYRRSIAIRPDPAIHSNLLYTLSYDDSISSEEVFAEYRRWDRMQAQTPPATPRSPARSADPERRIVVGYLSQDFRNHPLGRILAALFENHDPAKIQVNGYASIRRADRETERSRRRSAVWRNVVALSDDEAAAQIRNDGVDILIVFGGHAAHNRLLVAARRPAPIQIVYNESPSGMAAIDYWITDSTIHPPDGAGTTERTVETLLRLPSFFLHPPYEDAPPLKPPPVIGSGVVTFGSFSNPAKLTPTTIAAWASAMNAVPGSRLALKYMNWYGDAAVQRRIAGLFQTYGIAVERIVFAVGEHELGSHLALLDNVDIALDPYPFGGWTSTFEAMWMGVPVITLVGERFAGRTSLSVLEHIGLRELAVHRPEDFGGIAAALASDLPRLTALRRDLRERLRTSPLCDGRTQAGYFEAAYRDVWRRWCAGQAARGTR